MCIVIIQVKFGLKQNRIVGMRVKTVWQVKNRGFTSQFDYFKSMTKKELNLGNLDGPRGHFMGLNWVKQYHLKDAVERF